MQPMSKKKLLWESFNSRTYSDVQPAGQNQPAAADTSSSQHGSSDAAGEYARVLLAHAQLYVFADRYDVPALRQQCLGQLHQALLASDPERLKEPAARHERKRAVVDLLRYCYSNTTSARHGPLASAAAAAEAEAPEPLCALVAHYAACVMEELATAEDFGALLEESGAFARDLFAQTLKRLD